MQSLLERFVTGVVARHALLVSAVAVVLTLAGVAVIASRWNINSDFKALLPAHSEAALAMEEVGARVGSGSSLFVVVDSPDQKANIGFAEQLATELRALPEVALAHFHNDKSFFERHRLLYLEAEDLEALHERMKTRIRKARQKANPLFVALDDPSGTEEVAEVQAAGDGELLDTSDIASKYRNLAHEDYKEYLVSDDGYSLTIVVRFVETSTDLEATNRLLERVREVSKRVGPASFHPEMTVELGGGLVKRQGEYRSIVEDIQTSALFTALGLFLIIALYFRRVRAVFLVLTPLVMGVVWTLAVAFLWLGELTTITVFIFAVLLGLGIDFSIHLLSGYEFERRGGAAPLEAILRCYRGIGRATTVGAFTTFATFAVLGFAQFRGLSQFGLVASLGVLCTMLAMVVVLPALILAMEKVRPTQVSAPVVLPGAASESGASARIRSAVGLAKVSPVLLVVAVALMAWSVPQLADVQFEENFRAIGKVTPPWKRGTEDGVAAAERDASAQARKLAQLVQVRAEQVRQSQAPETYVADRRQKTLGAKYTSALRGSQSSTPTILLFDDKDTAERVYRHLRAEMGEGRLSTVRSLGSIYAFMPGTDEQQQERLKVIAAMRETLDTVNVERLGEKEREQIEAFAELLEVEAVTLSRLPLWTKRLFREAGPEAVEPEAGEEFAYGYLIYVNEAIDHMVGAQARQFLGELREAARSGDSDVRIGSQSYIYVAMLDEIRGDGLRMMLLAVGLVLVILGVFFRSPWRAAMAAVPLVAGVVWMLGFCAWMGIKLDFFNVIMLPVIIGVGIDDGVHFYHRYLELGPGSLGAVLRQVGSAVSMTTATSLIGFGGLAVTHYAGLQSLGYLAIVGLVSCWLATLLLMTSLIWLAERLGWRWVTAPGSGHVAS